VLAALGAEYSEEELAQACNTEPAGARLRDAATAARSLGFDALFMAGTTFESLLGWLDQDVPMIVSVAADELAYGAMGGHAIVVCGIEQGEVVAVDPAIGDQRRLPLDTFLRAWRRRGSRGLVVTR